MAKQGRTLEQLAAEITRRAQAKVDYVPPISRVRMAVQDDQPVLTMTAKEEQLLMPLQPVAHNQLAEYAGIPMAYYRRMHGEDRQLLALNVNRWLGEKGEERRMVRTLDGQVRALLSDSYRALENEDLAEVVLPIILESRNLLILSCEITDTRLYIKAVDRTIERDVPTGRKMGDGTHVFFDTCSPAITISNSEVGHGALSIETGIYTKACTNLAMIGKSLRKYHVGKRADMGDEMFRLLTDEAKRATDRATWLQARDLVKAALSDDVFTKHCTQLQAAAEDRLPVDDVPAMVERVGKKLALNEGERKGILARLIEGADLTRYGMHAAVTRHAQDVESYDRATELEQLGGEIIALPRHDWQRMVAA